MRNVPSAVLVMLSLFLAGGLIASRLPVPFMWTLALYALGALSYSLYFKRKAPMDTLVLAALYTLRVLAGNAATGIPPSFWLLAFSLFLFLSLAMSKRHAELMRLRGTAEEAVQGRDYWVADREMISQLGVSAGYISVLVLALYVNSPEAATQYERPAILWLLCVLVLFWITRLWLIAHRGQLHEDPVVFAIRDRTSQITGILSLMLLYLAA
jgi:4-hydroxybenzoate polyprenyltransferase